MGSVFGLKDLLGRQQTDKSLEYRVEESEESSSEEEEIEREHRQDNLDYKAYAA